MTGMKWALLVLAVAWVCWLTRVYRIIKQEDDRREMDDHELEEDRRRRALNGHVTTLDAWRQIERQPAIRRNARR